MVDHFSEEKVHYSNRDFANDCISRRPLAAPWGKVHLQIVKEFEHQLDKMSVCSAAFNQTVAESNRIIENCRDSINATATWGKNQIYKGADPKRAITNAYYKTCDYMDILDKRIHIQQRAVACQSKALSHMLKRDLHVKGNGGLIRRDAEMTHFQMDLGKTRHQELRNSRFSQSPLFHSQLIKERVDSFLKRHPYKQSQGFRLYQYQPFCGSHHNKRGCYRKRPYGGRSTSSSNQSYCWNRGNSNNKRQQLSLYTTSQGQRMW